MRFVVDDYQCKIAEVETGVPQGSPVSPILFAFYLSPIFKEVETEVEECMITLFVDNCQWLMVADLVP